MKRLFRTLDLICDISMIFATLYFLFQLSRLFF